MPTIDLAERLLDSAPVPMARVWFANSGSEANDHMVKFVWYYNNARGKPEKKKIIAREHGYHGIAVSSESLTGLPAMHKGFDLPIPTATPAEVYRERLRVAYPRRARGHTLYPFCRLFMVATRRDSPLLLTDPRPQPGIGEKWRPRVEFRPATASDTCPVRAGTDPSAGGSADRTARSPGRRPVDFSHALSPGSDRHAASQRSRSEDPPLPAAAASGPRRGRRHYPLGPARGASCGGGRWAPDFWSRRRPIRRPGRLR